MIASDTKYDEEDEDVVIAGSELHEALSKMGYSDYEVVSVAHQEESAIVDSYKSPPKQKSDGWTSKILNCEVFNIYRRMTKDSENLRKQLTTISEAQHLLDDHADLIKSLLKDEVYENKSCRIKYLISYLQYTALTTLGYYFIKRSNCFTWLIALPALTALRYKYARWRTNRDLKRLISEQTELHYSYKRALRILNHSFRMNTGAKQLGFKFTDLGVEKLKFLQPITEKVVKSLGTMSFVYYETSLNITELLPNLYRQNFESQITYFDKESFINCGEVTYDSLKQLFYRFILIQSEMLLLLAVLRHSEPKNLYDRIRHDVKIDHNVQKLLRLTTEHKTLIMEMVDAFHKHKLTVVEHMYRGSLPSKWQDLYVRLHLTTHELQKAYTNINSVLEDIENHLDRRTDETKLVESLKTKLSEVCYDVDKVRELAQLSALIISKMGQGRYDEQTENTDDDDNKVETSQPYITIVKDTDPEIIDEVFEEYIRERYSEALLNENGDNYLEKTFKLDKLLSRNLMSELKEALIDKQKDTRERESRALKRMNKNQKEETAIEDISDGNVSQNVVAEVGPSGSQLHNIKPESTNRSTRDESAIKDPKMNFIPMPPPPPMPKEFNLLRSQLKEVKKVEEQRPKCSISLPSSTSIPLPLFMSDNEETFIGSGENSDEEVVSGNEECEEENEKEKNS